MTDTATSWPPEVEMTHEAIARIHKAISRVTKHDAEGWLTINHLRAQKAFDEMSRIICESPELVDYIRRNRS